MCLNRESALWADALCPKTFDKTRYNDDSKKKSDEEDNFPKTDMHALISAVLYFNMENLQITPSNPAK